MTANNTPSVTMKFWIGEGTSLDKEPTQMKTFSEQEGVAPARIGLPEGQEPSKPEAGSYNYSGVHDHGPMAQPKEGGPMAQLLGCVQAAKTFSDDYLTKVIQEEKTSKK